VGRFHFALGRNLLHFGAKSTWGEITLAQSGAKQPGAKSLWGEISWGEIAVGDHEIS